LAPVVGACGLSRVLCREPASHIHVIRGSGKMADAKAAALDNETEIDEGADGAPEQGKSKFALKLPPLKFLIVGGAALLLLIGVGVGAYVFMFAHKHEAKVEQAGVKPVIFVDMPEVIVNLSNPSADRSQYLKIKIVLELPEQKMVEQITPVMPRVMDAFQTYLRELRPSDLDGSAGLYRLKEELTRRINASIAPNRINAVLFKEIVPRPRPRWRARQAPEARRRPAASNRPLLSGPRRPTIPSFHMAAPAKAAPSVC
jgi:flagellar FliL protein